jgi:hypothetical protein
MVLTSPEAAYAGVSVINIEVSYGRGASAASTIGKNGQ